MSDAATALSGATYTGAVTIEDAGPRGMITLRADLSDPHVGAAVESATGLALPGRREIRLEGDRGLAWMSPDEVLVMVPHDASDAMIDALRAALGDVHALVANVSDARCVIRLSGAGAREVLAKGAPVDLSPDAFGPGEIRRTRLGQVAAAFWMSGPDTFELVCFRSVGGFVFEWLCTAARPGGLPDHL